jgi:hypothetical protein
VSAALHLRVGPGPHGEWIVDEETGVCGAICASRDEALRFAKAECEAAGAADWRIVPTLDFSALFAPHCDQTGSTSATVGERVPRILIRL